MPRLLRGLALQDFAHDGEDLLNSLLASAQVAPQGASTVHADASRRSVLSAAGKLLQMQHVLVVSSSMPAGSLTVLALCAGEFGQLPGMSEEASSGSGVSANSVHIDVSSLQHYQNRVGPELRHMRQAQGRNRYSAFFSMASGLLPMPLACSSECDSGQSCSPMYIFLLPGVLFPS